MKAAVLLALSLFSWQAIAEIDNYSLLHSKPDANYCVKNSNECEALSKPKERILPDFKFSGKVTKADKRFYYAMHALDTLTTIRAVRQGYGKEVNPLLPKYPSNERIIVQKLATLAFYDYMGWTDRKMFISINNMILTGVVANNLNIVIKYEH